MKTPAAREREDVPRNLAASFDDPLPDRFQMRGKHDDQRPGRLMFTGAVYSRSDSAVLRIRIIVAPGLLRPAEHVAIKLFRGRVRFIRCRWKPDIIYPVLAWFGLHIE